MKKIFLFFICLYCLISCNNDTKKIELLLQDWEGKEIMFPKDLLFYAGDRDTSISIVNKFKIISYVDSLGCTSCKLKLDGWKNLISYMDSIYPHQIQTLLFLHPKTVDELKVMLRRADFEYPVCLDINDSFNKLNRFPSDMNFQTFLIDKNNKILAIGNPVFNPKVKELYLKIIQGQSVRRKDVVPETQTTIEISSIVLSLGSFPWKEEQTGTFTLKNTGDKPLVIQDAVTSCGCLTVDYSRKPIRSGEKTMIQVRYKADNPGYFNKVVTVYSNAKSSPLNLTVSGRGSE